MKRQLPPDEIAVEQPTILSPFIFAPEILDVSAFDIIKA
jgi:hypothetical protein